MWVTRLPPLRTTRGCLLLLRRPVLTSCDVAFCDGEAELYLLLVPRLVALFVRLCLWVRFGLRHPVLYLNKQFAGRGAGFSGRVFEMCRAGK